MNQNRFVRLPIAATLVIIVGVITGLVLAEIYLPSRSDLIVGLIVVLGASVLAVLLFIMAAGFTALGMNDPKEALGLPKGSVRAMIALLLIIVWVILSVYLFAFLGTLPTMPGPNGTTITAAPNQDSVRLAQQLYSTLATLIVAVVGFYFGSKNIAVAGSVTGSSLLPVITDIAPKTGRQNDPTFPLTIIGNNFRQKPSNVRLFLDQNNTIEGTNIALQSTERITCDIKIDAQKVGQYDVVVVKYRW